MKSISYIWCNSVCTGFRGAVRVVDIYPQGNGQFLVTNRDVRGYQSSGCIKATVSGLRAAKQFVASIF